MRRALLLPLLALLVAPGCDTDPVEFPDPDPDPVSVTIKYRVIVTGSLEDAAVRYTDADGSTVVDGFSRADRYNLDLPLEPETTGTFALSVVGTASEGTKVEVRVTAAETDNSSNEAAASDAVVVATTAGESLTAETSVEVPVLYPEQEVTN